MTAREPQPEQTRRLVRVGRGSSVRRLTRLLWPQFRQRTKTGPGRGSLSVRVLIRRFEADWLESQGNGCRRTEACSHKLSAHDLSEVLRDDAVLRDDHRLG